MLKSLFPTQFIWDCEWVPDVATGRRAYGLSDNQTDAEVLATMYAEGGATPENPRPYLKTALCRVVSISVVKRSGKGQDVHLEVKSLPDLDGAPMEEAALIAGFLNSVGATRPQLVGFNTKDADLPALLQRAVANRVRAPKFCARPNKPWEGMDYFDRYGDAHVDLKQMLGGFGKATPSLHELACACGLPGKQGTTGADVVDLWTAGRIREIVAYNRSDTVTLYHIFLRVALLAGFLTDEEFADELEIATTTIGGVTGRADKPSLARSSSDEGTAALLTVGREAPTAV